MSELKVYTNYHRRELVYYWELTQAEKDDFDWIKDTEDDDYTFFRYRNNTYCLSDFMRVERNAPAEFQKWDGYNSESFFSGILVKFPSDDSFDDGFITVGTYIG